MIQNLLTWAAGQRRLETTSATLAYRLTCARAVGVVSDPDLSSPPMPDGGRHSPLVTARAVHEG
jgi:hypothetical protein